jgi:hypothetical protein
MCSLTADCQCLLSVAPDYPLGMPELRERAKLLAKDAVASALFFDRYVKLTMRYLLGSECDLSSRPEQPVRGYGIFGPVEASFGSVEAQKKGTLHLHLLLWLRHAPSPDAFWAKLDADEAFRHKVFEWVRYCIKESRPEQVDSFGLREVSHLTIVRHALLQTRLQMRSAAQRGVDASAASLPLSPLSPSHSRSLIDCADIVCWLRSLDHQFVVQEIPARDQVYWLRTPILQRLSAPTQRGLAASVSSSPSAPQAQQLFAIADIVSLQLRSVYVHLCFPNFCCRMNQCRVNRLCFTVRLCKLSRIRNSRLIPLWRACWQHPARWAMTILQLLRPNAVRHLAKLLHAREWPTQIWRTSSS